MNMFARFDENPAMTLRVIKETKCYGRTDGWTDARTDNVKTVYPLQTKFAGGYKNYVIIASLKSERASKLINRIPGLRLLISSLLGKALRTHVESLSKPRDVNKRSQSLAW